MRYYCVVDFSECVWGIGMTKKSSIDDAVKWYNNYQSAHRCPEISVEDVIDNTGKEKQELHSGGLQLSLTECTEHLYRYVEGNEGEIYTRWNPLLQKAELFFEEQDSVKCLLCGNSIIEALPDLKLDSFVIQYYLRHETIPEPMICKPCFLGMLHEVADRLEKI
jgi:hypothetical protein